MKIHNETTEIEIEASPCVEEAFLRMQQAKDVHCVVDAELKKFRETWKIAHNELEAAFWNWLVQAQFLAKLEWTIRIPQTDADDYIRLWLTRCTSPYAALLLFTLKDLFPDGSSVSSGVVYLGGVNLEVNDNQVYLRSDPGDPDSIRALGLTSVVSRLTSEKTKQRIKDLETQIEKLKKPL